MVIATIIPNTLTDIHENYLLILIGLSIDVVGAMIVILPKKIVKNLYNLTNDQRIEVSETKEKQTIKQLEQFIIKIGVIIIVIGFFFQIVGNYLQAIR